MRCVILGAGGHARVLIDTLRASGAAAPEAILDGNPRLWGTDVMGVPVRGGDELLQAVAQEGISWFVIGVGGVGDNQPRRRLFELARSCGLLPLTVRHPAAICSTYAEIGPGSVLCPAAIVNAGAVLGMNVVVNSGAIVEHDCIVGDHVHIATGATLASSVRVGDGAHIGAGATVLQCVSIGESAVVGAGAAVIDDVAPSETVAGVPARPLPARSRQL